MPLDKWQERLEGHFAQLAAARLDAGLPLFALEHGLNEDELEEVGTLLRSRLVAGLCLSQHWLVWVVYATEIGYGYDGDEYWTSFEHSAPHWHERVTSVRRSQLRTWFGQFQASYHGVRPSGPWAQQFTIIAWPITHAIVPKYLQWQFAKSLYDLRYRLAHVHALSAEAIGQLLVSNAWDASSRFQEFLQQSELAGRITLALLRHGEVDGQSPIYPQTLHRLVSDLERVQSTHEWLKETRRFVADRLKGASRSYGGTSRGIVVQDNGAKQGSHAAPSIRPALMVRRTGASGWSIVVEIPSLAGVARIHPELQKFLRGTRCKINGAGDTWLPSGWLLSCAQRRVLKSWPGSNACLLKFERANSMVGHLVDSECRLSAGPIVLCRLGPDGLAREVRGRVVRPGGKYILLGETDFQKYPPFLAQCILDCDGIHAAVLSVPDILTAENINRLHQLGLQVSRTVRIWPAGVCARHWDGEGHS